jgi:hypothetical protein
MLRRIRLGLGYRPLFLIGGIHALIELTQGGGANQNLAEAIEYPEYESFDQIHYAAHAPAIPRSVVNGEARQINKPSHLGPMKTILRQDGE